MVQVKNKKIAFRDYMLNNFSIKINNMIFFDKALTHNSYKNENKLDYTYQRLEFLGDAILQQQVSLLLYHNEKNEDEGRLTKDRSNIVREETLATVVENVGLNRYIRLGNGEENSGGRKKPSILGDVFESITAAIYLDNEQNDPDKVVKGWLEKTLLSYIKKPEYLELIHDYKSELQELLQADNRKDLKYVVIKQTPQKNDNNILYEVSVTLDNQNFGVGKGFSKQQAEQQAAKNCLEKLRK